MGDLRVGVANIDDKGFYGIMDLEDKPVKAVASPTPNLQVSISFGRFENDSLSWEKFSAFSPNKYLEEVGKCATPGSVAQKKAYFEAHYKKIAERKAEIMDQEKQMDKNSSFRSIVTDQGSAENEHGGSVAESEVDDGSNGQVIWEEDKHVTEPSIGQVNEESVVVKECQSSVDQEKEEVNGSLDSPKMEKLEEIALVEEEKSETVVDVQEIPDQVVQVEDVQEKEAREEGKEEIPVKHTTGDTNERPIKEVKKEKKHNLIRKNDANVRMIPTRSSPKPNQLTTKPISKTIVTSRKTRPSKEVKSMMKATKKPAPPISNASPGHSIPRVYKQSLAHITSLSTSHSSLKKDNGAALLRNKQTGPKSLHISMSLGPSASDPTALTSTRKSLIMERMGDKDIVKRAFKSFQKSYDGQNTALKQNPAKATSLPSLATRQKENGRPTKASSVEKRINTTTNAPRSSAHGLKGNVTAERQQQELSKSGARHVEKTRLQKNPKAGVTDARTRRDSLNPRVKPMQGFLSVRTLPKGSLDKVL